MFHLVALPERPVWGLVSLGPEGADIGVAQVINKNKNDVGRSIRAGRNHLRRHGHHHPPAAEQRTTHHRIGHPYEPNSGTSRRQSTAAPFAMGSRSAIMDRAPGAACLANG